MDLVRDLLDSPVVDRNGRPMGRVDEIVLDVREDAPPRLVSVEIGPAVLAARIHPVLGRWVAAIERACGLADGRPVEIAVSRVTLTPHGEVRADCAIGDTAAAAVEQRIRGWIRRIPGA
jgi:sporulation protein YlmC with PRC-barrel domain